MRRWNNVTLEEIAPQVVTPFAKGGANRGGWRRIAQGVTPVVMFTAVLISSPTTQIQPNVSGNVPVISVPAITFERTHRARPAFLDQFKKRFEPTYVAENAARLKQIALFGSSNDVPGRSAGVVDAIAAFQDNEEWHPALN